MIRLNPVQLKREITYLQNELYKFNVLKQNRDRETGRSRNLKAVSSTLLL